MVEQENHFTVFIRLPFKRCEFIDPPQVAWSAAKERELWDVISKQSKSNDIDWGHLAEQFQVTQQFLLQQAAWLYERQLSQVRAQMRRMGNRPSATASPAPGSVAASVMGTQAPKRPTGLASRGPSRLSIQAPTTPTPAESSTPNTPARSRTSLPLKSTVPGGTSSNLRGHPTSSRPLSRKPSKDNEPTSRTQSRRGSIQQQSVKSPADLSSSSEDETISKPNPRRSNPAVAHRRTSSLRKSQHSKSSSLSVHQLHEQQEEDEDEDSPAFLPFANTSFRTDQVASGSTDPSATLRGGFAQPQPSSSARPALQRNHTSERVRPASTVNAPASTTSNKQKTPPSYTQPQYHPQLTSSASSLSSSNSPHPSTQGPPRHLSAPPTTTTTTATTSSNSPNTTTPIHRQVLNQGLPTPLSPRQQAALATAAGLSPRRRAANQNSPRTIGHAHTGSESSPSMGSSFSDLDDASVTQSALEEALMSNMNALGSTAGIGGGLGSRVSGISQALRSRYFDARGGGGGGVGGAVGTGAGANGGGGGELQQ